MGVGQTDTILAVNVFHSGSNLQTKDKIFSQYDLRKSVTVYKVGLVRGCNVGLPNLVGYLLQVALNVFWRNEPKITLFNWSQASITSRGEHIPGHGRGQKQVVTGHRRSRSKEEV